MHGPTCIFWANLTPFSLQVVGIVFPNVEVPQGSVVTDAAVLFTVDEVHAESSAGDWLLTGPPLTALRYASCGF